MMSLSEKVNNRIKELMELSAEEGREISVKSYVNFFNFMSLLNTHPAISLCEVDDKIDDIYVAWKDELDGNGISIRFTADGRHRIILIRNHKQMEL